MMQIDNLILFSRENKTSLQKFFGRDFPYAYLLVYQKHKLNAMALLSLESPIELSHFLKTPILQLEKIINTPEYKHYVIKKKQGGERHIFAPEEQLMCIQKRLNYYLQAYYFWIKPHEVKGFVINPHYLGPYCNIVANAEVHVGKNHILTIDLKDFFPSISAKQIKKLFMSPYFNYNEQVANALALLTTYESMLPTGAPTSPVLSNFICLALDASLLDFCCISGLHYSRYADDLTFSSDRIIPFDTVLDIILLIKKNGFEINQKKLRLQASNRKQTVTGLTVNEIVNVDRKLLKKIRAMLHDLILNRLEAATKRHFKTKEADARQQRLFLNKLQGYINFVGQVRGTIDLTYLKFSMSLDLYFISEEMIFQKFK